MDSVVPYLCNFFFWSFHYPRRHVWRIVIGTPVRRGSSFQNTSTLGIWVLDYFTKLDDEPVVRTIIDTTDRHKLRNPTLGQNSPSSFSSWLRCHLRTVKSMTDCHKLRRWSLLHFFAKKAPHSSFRLILLFLIVKSILKFLLFLRGHSLLQVER